MSSKPPSGLNEVSPTPLVDGFGAADLNADKTSRDEVIYNKKGVPLKVSWSSSGLPATARVNVFVTATGKRLGTFVVGGRSARAGLARVPRRFLAKGKNRIRLVVVDQGVSIDDVIGRTVIRAK